MVTKNSVWLLWSPTLAVSTPRANPNCRRCAQRLTNAVNYVLHPGVNGQPTRRAPWTAPHAVRRCRGARKKKTGSTHFTGIIMFGEIQSDRTTNGAYCYQCRTLDKTLSEFGLSEKEAQLYVHLLKYRTDTAVRRLSRCLKTVSPEVYRKTCKPRRQDDGDRKEGEPGLSIQQ